MKYRDRCLHDAYLLADGAIGAVEFLARFDAMVVEMEAESQGEHDLGDYSSDEWRAVGARLDQLAEVNETRMETLMRLLKDSA